MPWSASCSSASSTDSPPEKCGTDNRVQDEELAEKPICSQVKLKLCQALGRPDGEVVRSYGIPNKILVRETATASHVLLMGTTSFMLNPLRCPYAETLNSSDMCKLFRAAAPECMKSHLEGHHQMSNVLINLVCPCPPKWHNKKSCSVVKFDPFDNVLCGHIVQFHKDYYKRVQQALYDQKMNAVDSMRRIRFPSWTTTERLLPSQVIPDRIVFHTAVSNCPVQEQGDNNLLSHVAAVHPELIGRQLSADVKEMCSKYENEIVCSRIGMAVTNAVQTDDGTAGTKQQYLDIYRCPVENCSEHFLGKREHLIWHIRDHHACQWSLA